MSRIIITLLTFFVITTAPTLAANEYIIISGGPALRYYEKYKKKNDHDKYWGNFIDAAKARLPKIKSNMQPGDILTWMVYSPSYITRGMEMRQNIKSTLQSRLAAVGMTPYWFNNRDQLIEYINKGRDRGDFPISGIEYFGHSNRKALMFDYSNNLDGAVAEPLMLHIKDLKKIKRSSFASHAFSKSWGCHSGEAFSEAWLKQTRTPMEGAVGKTDYSGGGIPIISTPNGHWTTGPDNR